MACNKGTLVVYLFRLNWTYDLSLNISAPTCILFGPISNLLAIFRTNFSMVS